MANTIKYKTTMCSDVKDIMAQGVSRKAAAVALGIDYKTFLAYIDRYPEFAEAVAQADVLAECFWEKKYAEGALGVDKDVQPSMMIMYMKNRYRWSDRIEQQVTQTQVPLLDDLADE